jgi:uncharacterized protein (UPF0218 family)
MTDRQTPQPTDKPDDWRGEHLIRGQRPSQMRNPAGSITQRIARAVTSSQLKEPKK